MKRSGQAVWQGGLKDGNGRVSTESGVLKDTPYDFGKRFESNPGTNPEELVAAAHAACFSMALSVFLDKEGMKAESIETRATVTFEQVDGAWTVTTSHLDTTVRIPGADSAKFEKAAEGAKAGCPISRLLNAKITMDARLA